MDTTLNSKVVLNDTWKPYLLSQFSLPHMRKLRDFLASEKQRGRVIYPKGSQYFNAFEFTPFPKVKVVILGQDPYHGPGQAHGLCFSVSEGVPIPPSLANIYAEIVSDIGGTLPKSGCLIPWARQGVFLLNTVLTVEAGQPGSHRGRGWEMFTDEAIKALSVHREHLVFLLWGSHAQSKEALIDTSKHAVFKAPHPSPLSAHRGFLGCRHFSKTNVYLKKHGIEPIVWLSGAL